MRSPISKGANPILPSPSRRRRCVSGANMVPSDMWCPQTMTSGLPAPCTQPASMQGTPHADLSPPAPCLR